MQALKFGLILGNLNAFEKIVEFTKRAESCNFDHVLLSDHYYMSDASDLLETWGVIAYLAGVTSTIKLGTCVSPITLRPPLQFAKLVSTLDTASKGRIIVGVGAGWVEEEFRMFSQWHPSKERVAQFREALQILIDAWTKQKVTFRGKFYQVDNCVVEPKPVQLPHPQLWFGGWRRRMLQYAGQTGNGWVPTGPRSGDSVKSPQDYEKYVQAIKREITKSARSEEPFTFGCRFGPLPNPRDHLKEIEAFQSVGLNCYQLGTSVRKHPLDIVKDFADSVIACF